MYFFATTVVATLTAAFDPKIGFAVTPPLMWMLLQVLR
jgi:hypothetical protein